MRPYKFLFAMLAIAGMVFTGCDKSNDPVVPKLTLTPDNVTGKSGRTVEATLKIQSANGAGEVVVSKSINLQPDNTYGGSGTVTASPVATGDGTYEYHFEYVLSPDEVEKLVGFNFRFTDAKGVAAEKDLTVNTTTSGQQIIFSRKWKLTSRMWTTLTPPAEDKKECENDDVFSWNRDSTINITYGTSACTFDGFNVYDRWTLSEDEKTFTQVYHSLFDPNNITTEVYTVKTLTKDKLQMEITMDLSIFGPPFTDKEKFVYTFEPAP